MRSFHNGPFLCTKYELRVTFRVTFRVTKIEVVKTKCVEKRDT